MSRGATLAWADWLGYIEPEVTSYGGCLPYYNTGFRCSL